MPHYSEHLSVSSKLHAHAAVSSRDERGGLIEFAPCYTQKRENADEHDRIKAATNFNADWVLIAYVSILGAPA